MHSIRTSGKAHSSQIVLIMGTNNWYLILQIQYKWGHPPPGPTSAGTPGPASAGPPGIFPVTHNPSSASSIPLHHGFNSLVGSGGSLFPFGINGLYQTPTSAQQTNQYPPNWSYRYNLNRFNLPPPPPATAPSSQPNINIQNTSGVSNSGAQFSESVVGQDAIAPNSVVIKESRKSETKDISDELLALRVSSLLNESNLFKNVITKSLQSGTSHTSEAKDETSTGSVTNGDDLNLNRTQQAVNTSVSDMNETINPVDMTFGL